MSIPIPVLNADAIIVAAVGLVVAFAVLLGHAALTRAAISIYVGLVLAKTFGEQLFEFSKHSAGNNSAVSLMAVQLILLVLPILLLQFGHHKTHTHQRHSMVATVIVAVLTALLLISSVLTQLDQVTRAHITLDSNVAAQIYNLRLFWLALVPVGIAAAAIFKPKPH